MIFDTFIPYNPAIFQKLVPDPYRTRVLIGRKIMPLCLSEYALKTPTGKRLCK